MNRVCLVGRITKDPELKTTSSGISNVFFTLAVNRNRRDANGDTQADFISCIAWRNTAEFIGNYVKKGYQLSVEGRIQTRNWTDSNNQIHYVTEVQCDSVNNLTPRSQGQNQGGYQQSNQGGYNNQRSGYNNGSNQGYNQGNSYQQKPNSNNNQSFKVESKQNNVNNNNVKAETNESQSFNVNVIDDDLPF